MNNLIFVLFMNLVIVSLIMTLHLKSFLMKQCSYLISPKRTLEYREEKLLPTLNIYSPFNLKGWSYIRKNLFRLW